MITLDDLLDLAMTEPMFTRFVRRENRLKLDLSSDESPDSHAKEISRNFGGVLVLP